jgi:hypothetical protein
LATLNCLSCLIPIPYRPNNTGDDRNVRKVQWIDQNRYLIADCTAQVPNECYVTEDSLLIDGGAQYDAIDFAYDKVTETLVIAMSSKRGRHHSSKPRLYSSDL